MGELSDMKSKTTSVALSISLALVLSACASSKPAPAPTGDANAAKAAAPAKSKAGTPAPAGSKLAQITKGMADTDVRRILGEPDSSKDYSTGKQWIPYYYGPDTARTEYIYSGIGRITLTRNRYNGGLKVIRVDYDPNL